MTPEPLNEAEPCAFPLNPEVFRPFPLFPYVDVDFKLGAISPRQLVE